MRDPRSVADAWWNKALATRDSYDKFVYLWFAFNSLYNEFFEDREIDAIDALIYSDKYRLSDEAIQEVLNNSSVRFFERRIIRDCRGSGRDTSANVAKLKGNYRGRVKLLSLLKILYQVRCNLFHGNKEFGRDSDDEVVGNAANVLEEAIRSLIRPARRR